MSETKEQLQKEIKILEKSISFKKEKLAALEKPQFPQFKAYKDIHYYGIELGLNLIGVSNLYTDIQAMPNFTKLYNTAIVLSSLSEVEDYNYVWSFTYTESVLVEQQVSINRNVGRVRFNTKSDAETALRILGETTIIEALKLK